MVFTLGPSAHLRSLATGVGFGRISRSSYIARFVYGGVVKTFRYTSQMQKTPDVTRDDVIRVIARDFPSDVDSVLWLLENVSCPLIEVNRLHLAHLKLSGRSLQKLRESLVTRDGRDVVSPAEYPSYSKRGWTAIDKMTAKEVQAIIDDDWRQYETWLKAE